MDDLLISVYLSRCKTPVYLNHHLSLELTILGVMKKRNITLSINIKIIASLDAFAFLRISRIWALNSLFLIIFWFHKVQNLIVDKTLAYWKLFKLSQKKLIFTLYVLSFYVFTSLNNYLPIISTFFPLKQQSELDRTSKTQQYLITRLPKQKSK